ncbi:SDR family NAD(P)-dependent oxidoreductase [Segetibacter sp. 3557_3]|uniref:SDR family NAD(P)-dependent oxidoreductase n=1 Tax=Segetibacter sp. 3557_3 TaxID=2547429 RepID=UPI001058A3F5|nr:SDR family NAD(P)-dependent oxidoreductase [Segetibacter sp. 3557_3]TDH21242.1 SDR family NAD(P)-dependent oxidoreductase [Segetibacter sp. 3557_3]
MNKIIIITGATSGFGKAAAEKFAAEKWNCIITGRREEQLHAFADELRTKYHVRVLSLVFDVQQRDQVFAHLGNLPEEWRQVDVLLNNAGLALGREHIDQGDPDDWDTMIDTNVKGLLYVTRAVLPYLTARRQGHIINLGSVAGKDVYENGNVYCASKAAVDTLSHAMRIDLLQHSIKVSAIHPGAAKTEFASVRFKGDEDKAAQTYKGFEPLSAEDVAGIIYYTASLPAHICINDLVVTCTAQADGIYFFKQ